MNMHSDKKAWIKKCWQKTLSFLVRVEPILLFSIIAAFALLIRYSMFAVPSRDYEIFLSKWIEEIRTLGVKGAMGAEIGDYTPAYFYILVLLAYLPVPTLYSIKAVSCVFDVVMAVFVCLCVRELTKNKTLGFLSYCVTLLLPTVFFNSGMWAQCDGIFTAFCVMSVYFLLKEKKITAVILYGVAFSLKLQAIFLGPLFAVLYFKRKISLWSPLLVIGVYFLFCIPSWACGRSLLSLITVYFAQAAEYTSITLNAPTFAALFGGMSEAQVLGASNACIYLAFAVTAIGVYLFARKVKWQREFLVDVAMLFVLIVPFLLPRMHERYFYLADVFAVIYAFLHPKRAYTAVLTQFCSFWVVSNYLFDVNYFSLGLVALVQLINVLLLCRDLYREYGKRRADELLQEQSPEE